MFNVFIIPIAALQPSQLYVNKDKLHYYRETEELERLDRFVPVPVLPLNGGLVLADGHSRTLAAYRAGIVRIRACWYEDNLSLEAYRTCVRWCHQAGIKAIADLDHRIVDPLTYKTQWMMKCLRLQQEISDANPDISLEAVHLLTCE